MPDRKPVKGFTDAIASAACDSGSVCACVGGVFLDFLCLVWLTEGSDKAETDQRPSAGKSQAHLMENTFLKTLPGMCVFMEE